jgi:hypothetical protein
MEFRNLFLVGTGRSSVRSSIDRRFVGIYGGPTPDNPATHIASVLAGSKMRKFMANHVRRVKMRTKQQVSRAKSVDKHCLAVGVTWNKFQLRHRDEVALCPFRTKGNKKITRKARGDLNSAWRLGGTIRLAFVSKQANSASPLPLPPFLLST